MAGETERDPRQQRARGRRERGRGEAARRPAGSREAGRREAPPPRSSRPKPRPRPPRRRRPRQRRRRPPPPRTRDRRARCRRRRTSRAGPPAAMPTWASCSRDCRWRASTPSSPRSATKRSCRSTGRSGSALRPPEDAEFERLPEIGRLRQVYRDQALARKRLDAMKIAWRELRGKRPSLWQVPDLMAAMRRIIAKQVAGRLDGGTVPPSAICGGRAPCPRARNTSRSCGPVSGWCATAPGNRGSAVLGASENW